MKLVKHDDIDPIKWNACLSKMPYAHFYGLYQYLTAICKWEAIIEEVKGDYVFVMPLPYKKKLGLKYLYQPLLCQQLGVFGTITAPQQQLLLSIIRKSYVFGTLNLSSKLVENKSFTTSDQPNYILDLNNEFEFLKQKFNSNRKRTLKRSSLLETTITTASNKEIIDATINRFRDVLGDLFPEVETQNYAALKNGLASIIPHSKVEVKQLIYEQNTVAAVLTVEYNGRIVYLLGYIEDAHRKSGMNALLFEKIIEENAPKSKIFDFEGSKNEGIAKFYQSFGATKKPYVQMVLRKNMTEILKIVR